MSTSDAAAPLYTLRLPRDPQLRVTVRDGHMKVVAEFIGTANDIPLKRGLYSVRIEGPYGVVENAVRLDRDVDLSDAAPKRVSAAPIAGGALTHEYYSGPSAQFSKQRTGPPLAPASDAALFIFVRTTDRGNSKELAGTDVLSLHRADGALVTRFEKGEAAHGFSDGWLAYSVDAPAGFYRLRVGGDEPRELGVHAFAGWQTQVFLIADKGTPLLAAARVFLARPSDGFSPDDEQLPLVDDAMAILSNPSASPTPSMISALLHQKRENPTLGLLGAWMLLREGRRVPSERNRMAEDLDRVITVLRSLLGECSDVRALRIAMTTEAEWDSSWTMFNEPPMMAVGLRRVIDAARAKPWVFADSVLMESICEHAFSDSVWTTWASLIQQPHAPDTTVALHPGISGRAMGMVPPQQAPIGEPLSWVEESVLSSLTHAMASQGRRSIRKGSSEISAEQLAKQLAITPKRVAQALGRLDQLGVSLATGTDAEGLRQSLGIDNSTFRNHLGNLSALIKEEPL